ncbi:MAG: hypothetical protein KYX69_09975 [Sphingomonas sp.]|uniref:hypothetical protein n=1 Tax=Sphingomonas sp. TaxID=28214 RepID=UPI002624B91A|nr:hypothetical protein [Sphingomonas sp.]MDK2768030.1 hypothetical protein [Sphingomonas sp.]
MSWIVWLAMSVSGAGAPLSVSCTVAGGEKAGLDARAVCARFVEQLSAAAARPYALVPVGERSGDGMTVSLRVVRSDTMAADVTVIERGRARSVETRMISSSDRPLGLDSIGLLARDVARAAALSD